ncbi:MAG: S-adenosylmethionine:tRNA ribosyltransferase-isomerase [Actinobacteria bacterium]|nr:S-adenosylmethionine:tRNA ribosyltransferase-isomerase [Actinomycetota bacterium]
MARRASSVAPAPRPATEPPEARGRSRDDVRLLVAREHRITHARFRDLALHLEPGDLVVVNTSATLPAALDGTRQDGAPVTVHVATRLDARGEWIVELRRPDGTGPQLDGRPGEVIGLPGGARAELLTPWDAMASRRGPRLWRARVTGVDDAVPYLHAYGQPITYGYLEGRWPLAAYQPLFARRPGSAEMASAGRPFTTPVVVDLIAAGTTIAPVTLHAGVSSLEAGEGPQPERFEVPEHTAALVEHTRRRGRRVVAVGTTVVRALESAIDRDGRVRARSGWTDLVLGPHRLAAVVTGLVTGWHDRGSSHLDLLQAVAGRELVEAAYHAAGRAGYRWHEFGDSCLLLP